MTIRRTPTTTALIALDIVIFITTLRLALTITPSHAFALTVSIHISNQRYYYEIQQ